MISVPTKRTLALAFLLLILTAGQAWSRQQAATAKPANDVTYTTINVQHSSAYWKKMHWAGADSVDLRVTLWFPPGAACESGSVEVTVSTGEMSPNEAAKAIFDNIRAFWPNIEVHYNGRTVTVWGTSSTQTEGTEDKPATTGGTDDQAYVSYYTVTL